MNIDERIREMKATLRKDMKSLKEDIKTEDWYMAYISCKWLVWDLAYLDILANLKQELKRRGGRK